MPGAGAGAGLFVLLFLVLAVGAPLLLYVLVRSEHDQRTEMDREDAERVARRDRPDDERERTGR